MWSLLSLPFVISAVRAAGIATEATISTSNGSTVDMVSAAWYAGWHSKDFPVANVSWEKYTHVTYSFAVTTPDIKNLSLDASSPEVFPDFVSAAKKNGVKALVSIGGWTGSLYFSSHVATAENRTQFVKTVVDLATTHELDGVDFDWEYPGNQGIGCNVISPNDTSNFLAFLQELRQDPTGQKLVVTAAAPISPWRDADGNPSADVSAFAKVLDYVAIMNYDISGPWLTYVGPNAPLDDSCAPAANQQGSATGAIKAWTTAGVPSHQLVLGVPAYGHSYIVTPADGLTSNNTETPIIASFPAFDKSQHPKGDKWDDGEGVDECGVQQSNGGNFNFIGLIEAGMLFPNGTATAAVDYRFDECSQTPYLYNETSQLMVSFDDAKSFSAKGNFIKENNLRGFAIWESAGDNNDILLNSIRTAAGFDEDC